MDEQRPVSNPITHGIFARMQDFFTPPAFPDDEDKTRRAANLFLLLKITIVGTFVVSVNISLNSETPVPSLFGMLGILYTIGLIMIANRGRVKLAAMLFVYFAWLNLMNSAVDTGGVMAVGYTAGGLLCVLLVAVLLDLRHIAYLYVLTIAFGIMMMFLETNGMLPETRTADTPHTRLFAYGFFLMTGSGVAYIAVRSIQKSLEKSQRELAERKKTEAALRESEERFRLISTVTSDYTFSTRVNARGDLEHLLVTGAFEKITGYTVNEYHTLGGWRSLVHPDDMAQDAQDMARLNNNQQVISELRIIRKGGSVAWVRVYAQPVWDDAENRLVGINGGVQDITQQKRAELALIDLYEDLEDKATQLATLNEIAYDISSLTDLKTTLQRVLTKLQSVLPVDAFYVALHEPETQTVTFPILYDDGEYWHQERGTLSAAGWVSQVLETGKPIVVNRTPEEMQDRSKEKTRLGNTTRVSASILMAPLPYGEKNIGVISVQSYTPNSYTAENVDLLVGAGYQIGIAVENARLYDSLRDELGHRKRLEAELQRYNTELEKLVDERTNALRRTNEQFQLVLNNTTNALAFADPSGDLLVTNPAFRATFSEKGAKAIEFILWSLARDDHVAIVGDALLKVIYDREAQQIEAQVISENGTPVDLDLSLVPVELQTESNRNGVLLSGHDITLIKEIDRFKERFVADALHDLATPITGISTRLYLLQRSPDKITDHVQALENQVQHLRNLLDDLRTLSQVDRGQINLNTGPCDINALVQRVYDTYEPVAITRSQTLTLQTAPANPVVTLDERQIERVLVNLVANAINYTPDGKTIHIETATQDKALVIIVRDAGMGIAPEDLPHIFERFYRTDAARTNVSTGTGLGLAITREIVEMHGGTVTATSAVGEGSTFVVQLPTEQ